LPQQPPEQQLTKTYTYFAGCFDGHGSALVRYHVHRSTEKVQGFTRATGHHHWASIMFNNIKGTYLHWFLLMFFIVNTLKTGAKQKDGRN
jgi:hypothetical protein